MDVVENLKWKKTHVLNDGFICLVDVMGNDDRIVQAARTSYGKDRRNDPYEVYREALTKYFDSEVSSFEQSDDSITIRFADPFKQNLVYQYNENFKEVMQLPDISINAEIAKKDRGLIRRLMNDGHTSPFEKVKFEFLIRVPMDCWRQWIRHRTADVNEYSTRYSEAIDSQQVTLPGEWRLQSKDNKQGSSGFLEQWPEDCQVKVWYDDELRYWVVNGLLDNTEAAGSQFYIDGDKDKQCTPGQLLSHLETQLIEYAQEIYRIRLQLGVAREQARKDLPLSTYTEAYWGCSLHNIFNFLRLRLDKHAQLEIRLYAQAMYDIIKQVCPIACEAFEDYVLQAVKFSRMEMKIIHSMYQQFLADDNAITKNPDHGMTDNEWKTFLEKISC